MMQKQRNRILVLLMGASLAMLGIFLWVWLGKVYADKHEELQQQTNLVFYSAIQEVEDVLFQKVIARPLEESTHENGFFLLKQSVSHIESDTNMMFSFKQKEPLVDSNMQITIKTKVEEEAGIENQMKGSLSMFIAMVEGAGRLDSLPHQGDSLAVLSMLDDRFGDLLALKESPQIYKVVQLSRTDTLSEGQVISSSYRDVISGEQYAVELGEVRPFLLRQMIPESLFALILVVSIVLAFWMVYRSLIRQQRLTAIKNDFISNMTHELKTPITTVGVAIEALREFDVLKDAQKTEEYLDISRHELSRLSILVDKVLKMSLFEKAGLKLKPEELDLKELLEEVLNSMKLQFEKVGADVRFRLLGESFMMQGDRMHLTSVIYNLIDNAVKYSKEKPEIEVRLTNGEEELQLQVRDRGIGIPKAFQDKVFDKFFRVPTSDRHNARGHGLGLNYVATVVEKHHGHMELESREGGGTIFTVHLPKKYV